MSGQPGGPLRVVVAGRRGGGHVPDLGSGADQGLGVLGLARADATENENGAVTGVRHVRTLFAAH